MKLQVGRVLAYGVGGIFGAFVAYNFPIDIILACERGHEIEHSLSISLPFLTAS